MGHAPRVPMGAHVGPARPRRDRAYAARDEPRPRDARADGLSRRSRGEGPAPRGLLRRRRVRAEPTWGRDWVPPDRAVDRTIPPFRVALPLPESAPRRRRDVRGRFGWPDVPLGRRSGGPRRGHLLGRCRLRGHGPRRGPAAFRATRGARRRAVRPATRNDPSEATAREIWASGAMVADGSAGGRSPKRNGGTTAALTARE